MGESHERFLESEWSTHKPVRSTFIYFSYTDLDICHFFISADPHHASPLCLILTLV